MAPPRIVHVYKDVYPKVEGGIERTIYLMARLTVDAFEPAIITAASGPRRSTYRLAPQVEVTEVATYGRLLSTPLSPGFTAALKASRADLFHFHFPHPTGEAAFLASGLDTPSVVTYHSDVVRQKTALRLYRPLMNRFLKRMNVIMPTSQRYLETSETLAPFAERCRVVPLGLPLEDYAADEAAEARAGEYRDQWGEFVLFLGVLRYYKGLHFLLEAMTRLPGVHLAIAGEGKEGRKLRELVEDMGLQARVHFLGWVDHRTAVALLHAASVFCLPAHARSEAFGLCQIEAMACGLPVVSTDLRTGVPEVNRHEETGLIVPPADAEGLAVALGRLLEDSELRARLGAGGRERSARLYTAERMAEDVSEIYREVLNR